MQQAAEILMAEVDALVARVRRGSANAADHLERSAEAVMFNIGEGVAAHKPRIKIAAYEVARKEANEVRAILRRLMIGKRLTQRDIQRAYNLSGAIVGMLTRAIITLENR